MTKIAKNTISVKKVKVKSGIQAKVKKDASLLHKTTANAEQERPKHLLKPIAVTTGVYALLEVIKLRHNEEKKKTLFKDDPKDIMLQIVPIKIPITPMQQIRVVLPHPLTVEGTDVCLITQNVKKATKNDHEPTIAYYKSLLQEKQIKGITEIVPIRQLRSEHVPFEMKGRFADMYDMFLVDGRLFGKVTKFLGSRFFKKNKDLIPVKINTDNVKEELEKALAKTVLTVHGLGDCYSVKVGFSSFSSEQLEANIFAVADVVAESFPGGFVNIRKLLIKSDRSMAIPIYLSLTPHNSVPVPVVEPRLPKAHVPVEGELTTQLGKRVTVMPTGEVIVRTVLTDEDVEMGFWKRPTPVGPATEEPRPVESEDEAVVQEEEAEVEVPKAKPKGGKKRKMAAGDDSSDEDVEAAENAYVLELRGRSKPMVKAQSKQVVVSPKAKKRVSGAEKGGVKFLHSTSKEEVNVSMGLSPKAKQQAPLAKGAKKQLGQDAEVMQSPNTFVKPTTTASKEGSHKKQAANTLGTTRQIPRTSLHLLNDTVTEQKKTPEVPKKTPNRESSRPEVLNILKQTKIEGSENKKVKHSIFNEVDFPLHSKLDMHTSVIENSTDKRTRKGGKRKKTFEGVSENSFLSVETIGSPDVETNTDKMKRDKRTANDEDATSALGLLDFGSPPSIVMNADKKKKKGDKHSMNVSDTSTKRDKRASIGEDTVKAVLSRLDFRSPSIETNPEKKKLDKHLANAQETLANSVSPFLDSGLPASEKNTAKKKKKRDKDATPVRPSLSLRSPTSVTNTEKKKKKHDKLATNGDDSTPARLSLSLGSPTSVTNTEKKKKKRDKLATNGEDSTPARLSLSLGSPTSVTNTEKKKKKHDKLATNGDDSTPARLSLSLRSPTSVTNTEKKKKNHDKLATNGDDSTPARLSLSLGSPTSETNTEKKKKKHDKLATNGDDSTPARLSLSLRSPTSVTNTEKKKKKHDKLATNGDDSTPARLSLSLRSPTSETNTEKKKKKRDKDATPVRPSLSFGSPTSVTNTEKKKKKRDKDATPVRPSLSFGSPTFETDTDKKKKKKHDKLATNGEDSTPARPSLSLGSPTFETDTDKKKKKQGTPTIGGLASIKAKDKQDQPLHIKKSKRLQGKSVSPAIELLIPKQKRKPSISQDDSLPQFKTAKALDDVAVGKRKSTSVATRVQPTRSKKELPADSVTIPEKNPYSRGDRAVPVTIKEQTPLKRKDEAKDKKANKKSKTEDKSAALNAAVDEKVVQVRKSFPRYFSMESQKALEEYDTTSGASKTREPQDNMGQRINIAEAMPHYIPVAGKSDIAGLLANAKKNDESVITMPMDLILELQKRNELNRQPGRQEATGHEALRADYLRLREQRERGLRGRSDAGGSRRGSKRPTNAEEAAKWIREEYLRLREKNLRAEKKVPEWMPRKRDRSHPAFNSELRREIAREYFHLRRKNEQKLLSTLLQSANV